VAAGCAALALCAATALDLSAQTFTTLHSFDRTDGERPMAALIQVTSGDLYGTTNSGGSGDGVGFGTAFAISPSGTFKTIDEFCSQTNTLDDCLDGASPTAPFLHCADGANPETALIQAPNRDFCSQSGCADGANPGAGLIHATNGDFYGTTSFGGLSGCGVSGCGTVFKVTAAGAPSRRLCRRWLG
jgi:uncharacterized repeat protein (TIGR03803 family)